MENKRQIDLGAAQELFDEAPCGYLHLDQEGRIIALNKTLLDWLGYRNEEVADRLAFLDLLPMGGKIYYETHHYPLEKLRGHVEELSYDLICKNGQRLPVLVTSRQVRLTEDRAYFYRYIVFNITDRKKYEQELLQAKKMAEAASRAKDVFLARVSHEIRTPMHAVLSIADFLSETEMSEEQQTLLTTLRFSANTLLDFIGEVRDLSELDAGQMEIHTKDFQLIELCRQLLRHTSIMLRDKPIQIELSIADTVPDFLRGDVIKLQQILNHLLLNAVKFTQEGTITLEVVPQLVTDNSCILVFSIQDTGVGIELDQMDAIFQPFAQADFANQLLSNSTGLGLTISKQLIALLGGELAVESNPGKGARFSFALRLERGKPLQLSEPAREVESFSLQGLQILLVEDNYTNIFIAARILRDKGATVDVAENGKDALYLAASTDYDIILMDLQMPILNGYATTQQLRYMPRHASTPVIALTAAGKEEAETRYQEAGMDGFLLKPFRAEQLLAAIQRCLLPKPGSGPAKESAEDKTENSSVDPENLYDLIGRDDASGIKELIEAMQLDLRRQIGALGRALLNRDRKQLASIRHALKTVFRLTEPQPLVSLLAASKVLLESNPEEEELEARAKELDRALKAAITDLGELSLRV